MSEMAHLLKLVFESQGNQVHSCADLSSFTLLFFTITQNFTHFDDILIVYMLVHIYVYTSCHEHTMSYVLGKVIYLKEIVMSVLCLFNPYEFFFIYLSLNITHTHS